MKPKTAPSVARLAKPEEQDYPAAQSCLSLIYPRARCSKFITALRAAPVNRFKAKDVFRASGLSLLGVSNSHVDPSLHPTACGWLRRPADAGALQR